MHQQAQSQENYVQEILTLERHIDYLTKQLEAHSVQLQSVCEERDQLAQ